MTKERALRHLRAGGADAEAALARWRAQVKKPGGFTPVSDSNAVAPRERLAQAELQAERAQMDALCDWLDAHQSVG